MQIQQKKRKFRRLINLDRMMETRKPLDFYLEWSRWECRNKSEESIQILAEIIAAMYGEAWGQENI